MKYVLRVAARDSKRADGRNLRNLAGDINSNLERRQWLRILQHMF
jgi:hypothetical protein